MFRSQLNILYAIVIYILLYKGQLSQTTGTETKTIENICVSVSVSI